MMQDIVNAAAPVVVSYTGPCDIVASPTAFYGLRACGASQLGGTTKAVRLRRASDSTACDFDINTSGNLDGTDSGCSLGGGLSLATFATQDATATCTISTTTATCTGASSTPHVGSTVTGTGVTNPCYVTAVGTFTGGAGTATVNGNGAASPCGTISVGETMTFTYGLYGTEWYDQSSNGYNVVQATAGNQPQLLPTCISTLPCFSFVSANSQYFTGTLTSIGGQPYTASMVIERVGNTAAFNTVFGYNNLVQWGFSSTANKVLLYAGSVLSETAADLAPHAYQGVINTTSSATNVDGTETTGLSAGSAVISTSANFWGVGSKSGSSSPGNYVQGFVGEAGLWPVAATPTNRGSLHTNQSAYWGTP